MTIHLRKMYVDSRFGQLHLHTAFPSSGGFDELTPLLCAAPPSQTGPRVPAAAEGPRPGPQRVCARPAGRGRIGRARSRARRWPTRPQRSSTSSTRCASSRSMSSATRAGTLAAIEFALARPEQVRRVLLLGVPASDGGYQVGERLPLLRQPVTILRAHDEFWDSTARAEALLREARRVDLTYCARPGFRVGIRRDRADHTRIPRPLTERSPPAANRFTPSGARHRRRTTRRRRSRPGIRARAAREARRGWRSRSPPMPTAGSTAMDQSSAPYSRPTSGQGVATSAVSPQPSQNRNPATAPPIPYSTAPTSSRGAVSGAQPVGRNWWGVRQQWSGHEPAPERADEPARETGQQDHEQFHAHHVDSGVRSAAGSPPCSDRRRWHRSAGCRLARSTAYRGPRRTLPRTMRSSCAMLSASASWSRPGHTERDDAGVAGRRAPASAPRCRGSTRCRRGTAPRAAGCAGAAAVAPTASWNSNASGMAAMSGPRRVRSAPKRVCAASAGSASSAPAVVASGCPILPRPRGRPARHRCDSRRT